MNKNTLEDLQNICYKASICEDLQQENQQLKNIIDELEKWLKEERKRLRKSIKPINDIRVEIIDTIEYKLQELKGSDKEC